MLVQLIYIPNRPMSLRISDPRDHCPLLFIQNQEDSRDWRSNGDPNSMQDRGKLGDTSTKSSPWKYSVRRTWSANPVGRGTSDIALSRPSHCTSVIELAFFFFFLFSCVDWFLLAIAVRWWREHCRPVRPRAPLDRQHRHCHHLHT